MQAVSFALAIRAVGVCALIAGSVPANAQSDVQRDCRPALVSALEPSQVSAAWRPYLPSVVLTRHSGDIGREDFRALMRGVVASARAAVAKVSDPALASRYRDRLDDLESGFGKYLTLSGDAQARYLADSIGSANFQLNESPAGNRFPIFAGTAREIVVTQDMPESVRRGLCWPTMLIARALTLVDAENRARTVATLDALASRWESYTSNGYSQLPWELALNSAFRKRSDWEPPAYQWILMHPSIGTEASGTRWTELQRTDLALLEVAGFLAYNGERDRYWGLSAITAFASDAPVGAGAYAHLWFPQAKVGYLFRSSDAGIRRRGFLVSVDIYDLVAGVPEELEKAKDSAMGQKVLSLLKGTR